MKTYNLFLLISSSICAILYSCESDTNKETDDFALTFELSDGNMLTENDIEFYDSSTYTYFFKSDVLSETPITDFKILVNGDSVLGGALHLCILSSMPPTPYFITDCFFSGSNILTIGFYGDGNNMLNNSRIINSLAENNKFRRGLSCNIDSIEIIKSDSQTDIITTITITNHDNIFYYIPDLNKMGERFYTDYTGSISLFNLNTGLGSFIKEANSNRQRDDIKLADLSKLAPNSKVVYTYKSRNYYEIPKGEYKVRANFMGVVYTASEFELYQDNGRIWVGQIHTYKDGIIVE